MKKFCAHKGLSGLIPENTLPAFVSAAVLGADEIEFDVRLTKDGQLIVSHDEELEHISDGQGLLQNFTLQELKQLNLGIKRGWNVPFCTVDEVFMQLANKLTFNIHLKEHGTDGYLIKELLKLVKKHDAFNSVYFASSADVLVWTEKLAPQIPRVAIQLPWDEMEISEMARTYHCTGVQLWYELVNQELINKLHSMDIFCNVFYADDFEGYDRFFHLGIDTVLTNRMDIAMVYKKNNNL